MTAKHKPAVDLYAPVSGVEITGTPTPLGNQWVTAATAGIRLDLGCGETRPDGWIGYDIRKDLPTNVVDVVQDLEKTPWKGKEDAEVALVPWDGAVWMWPGGSVCEARFHRSLEYMGASPSGLRAIFAELARVMKPLAPVTITYLNPKNDTYFDDPDVVRPITAGLIYALGGFEVVSCDAGDGGEVATMVLRRAAT